MAGNKLSLFNSCMRYMSSMIVGGRAYWWTDGRSKKSEAAVGYLVVMHWGDFHLLRWAWWVEGKSSESDWTHLQIMEYGITNLSVHWDEILEHDIWSKYCVLCYYHKLGPRSDRVYGPSQQLFDDTLRGFACLKFNGRGWDVVNSFMQIREHLQIA